MSKRGAILKEFDDALRDAKKKLKELENNSDSEEYSLYSKQLQALEEVNEYISSYDWVGREEVVKKVKFVRDSNYDYDLVRKELNLSADALKSLLFRMNKRLIEHIGPDTIDLITSHKNTVGKGIVQFRICSGKYSMKDIILKGVMEKLPKEKFDFYNIYDCINEIKFLYKYSDFGMEEALDSCDLNKLAFLLYITQNPVDRYSSAQKDLIMLLQGLNIELNDYIEMLDRERLDNENNNLDYYMKNKENSNDEENIDFGDFEGIDDFSFSNQKQEENGIRLKDGDLEQV